MGCRAMETATLSETAVGSAVGLAVGEAVGLAVGKAVGLAVGSGVGLAVGEVVGTARRRSGWTGRWECSRASYRASSRTAGTGRRAMETATLSERQWAALLGWQWEKQWGWRWEKP